MNWFLKRDESISTMAGGRTWGVGYFLCGGRTVPKITVEIKAIKALIVSPTIDSMAPQPIGR
jgi:hypothetical protein